MACAASVRVGPARQSFWAVHLRGDGRLLREGTHVLGRGGAIALGPGSVRIRERGVLLDLALEEQAGVQTRCAHGEGGRPAVAIEDPEGGGGAGALAPGEVWTRKQAGVRAYGRLALDGGSPRAIEALAVIDDTAGYHPRRTEWWWSAGVGTGEDGAALAWNLVRGVNDPPTGSERAVWIDGVPREAPPVRFAADLSEIVAADADDGSRLSFAARAVRRRSENLLLVRSDYTAPFGTFSGTLPGGLRLQDGLGVMEHHRARW